MTVNHITTPSLKRRLASMLYEAMLVFAIVFAAGLLFSIVFEQRHALYLRHAMLVWLVIAVGAYFTWFWTHGGQTLAMKTWKLRLVDLHGHPIGFWKASIRYLLAWLWFLPGLALAWFLGAQAWMLIVIPLANAVIWAIAVYHDPQRQFLHDRIAGTRLITVGPLDKTAPA